MYNRLCTSATICSLTIHITYFKETENIINEKNLKYNNKTGLQQPTEAKISA